VVDPRETPTAREADVHLALRSGTNVALLNALMHELIANGWIDPPWIDTHTVGFQQIAKVAEQYPPERAAEICRLDAGAIREAARIIGEAEALLSLALQGVYQSNQATAAACMINNVNLVRDMIGRPGCGILQMNGQPTAQNTRETGCDGDLPGFRNWQNDEHVADLARVWNLDPLDIPHWAPPTHVLEMFRLAEQGALQFLWIISTNPAVSLPELHRIRSILEQERLFVVVSDAFLTETAQLADVVLPAAIWGEKTGTFTNADRTVHLSEKAVDPPGAAKPDMEIFIEVAERLGLRDRDGQPLIKWRTPEEAFEAWKECSRGRFCDYTGITYEKLRGGSGIQWPCNEEAPEGTARLYTDGVFKTATDETEDYGHDLTTGASFTEKDHRAINADGRAILKAAKYVPPREQPDEEYPYSLATGRTVHHFHTRTKTGRSRQLHDAAPDVWVELSAADAERLGVAEGDRVRVTSPRGSVEAPARVNGSRDGIVFLPFHYGYWDEEGGHEPNGHGRAANELTMTLWDPVSKQPLFKAGKVRVEKLGV
jgi:anaerobic selenocysteine-containing dehydrogenase